MHVTKCKCIVYIFLAQKPPCLFFQTPRHPLPMYPLCVFIGQVRKLLVMGGKNNLKSHPLPNSIQFRRLSNCLPCITMCIAIFLKFYLWHIPVSLQNSSEGLNISI